MKSIFQNVHLNSCLVFCCSIKSHFIEKRDKKAFLNEQLKKIQENNRMGKTRDLFKKSGDIKRAFHTRMGMKKDRNYKGHNRSRRD